MSRQLGHFGVSVTARHCARWIDYQADAPDAERGGNATRLELGEVFADLFARMLSDRNRPHQCEGPDERLPNISEVGGKLARRE